MIDLTAPVETFGVTPDITHIDLCCRGAVSPLTSLVTDCVLIDLRRGAEDLDLASIPELGLIEKGNSVILRTGWERYRGTPRYDESPWVDKKLIERLFEKGVVLVLVDSPGLYGGKRGPEHSEMDRYLAGHGAYAVENIVNVGQLSRTRFRLYCFPIHMTSQNSAPCRVIADYLSTEQ